MSKSEKFDRASEGKFKTQNRQEIKDKHDKKKSEEAGQSEVEPLRIGPATQALRKQFTEEVRELVGSGKHDQALVYVNAAIEAELKKPETIVTKAKLLFLGEAKESLLELMEDLHESE